MPSQSGFSHVNRNFTLQLLQRIHHRLCSVLAAREAAAIGVERATPKTASCRTRWRGIRNPDDAVRPRADSRRDLLARFSTKPRARRPYSWPAEGVTLCAARAQALDHRVRDARIDRRRGRVIEIDRIAVFNGAQIEKRIAVTLLLGHYAWQAGAAPGPL